jgi:predicted baseplate assembly protein w
MNRFTGEKITDETAHIKQSIADILLTPIGSRIQRRNYGSRIPELIDRPMNHALLLQLAAASVMALTKWEPRIQISKFQPRISENGIVCTIVARKRNNNQNVNFDDLFLGGKQ